MDPTISKIEVNSSSPLCQELMRLPFVLLQVLLSTTTFAFSPNDNRNCRMASSSSCQLSQSQDKSSDQVKCAPCASMDPSSLLDVDQVQARLASNLPLWELLGQSSSSSDATTTTTGNRISRKFMARNFQAALDAMNAFGALAEEQGHHPDLLLTNYRHVEVVLWTHKVGGITENDLLLAALFDEHVKIDYSPQWLNEHPHAKATAKINK